MSVLAGRLAATEGAYFLNQSKNAVANLAQNLPKKSSSSAATGAASADYAADVLPEILRHSVPLKFSPEAVAADSTLAAGSKWLISGGSSGAYYDVRNPLRDFVSLPQATFGPKRWQLPSEQSSLSASTANDLRQDRYSSVDPEKLKAVVAGYSQVGKAFAVATLLVFGGAAVVFVHIANKLQLHNIDDIRNKGKEVIQPRADILKEQMGPFRDWAANISSKWRIKAEGEAKEKTIVKELSRTLGARTSN